MTSTQSKDRIQYKTQYEAINAQMKREGDVGLRIGRGEEMGLEVGLEDGEGHGIADQLGEGVPEPGSCPGEGSVPKTAEVGLVDGEETG